VIGFLYQGGRGAIWQIAVSYKSVSWQQYNTVLDYNCHRFSNALNFSTNNIIPIAKCKFTLILHEKYNK